MKISFSRQPLHLRRRFSQSDATARSVPAGNAAVGTNLRPEDGYDWLRRIKPIRAAQRAGR
ncbi:hypothetical protein RHOFW104T7_17715 [Rhodanobacter thiooxydans]|uniref:Uncharacterized protein n=1 Tax=Rhodanobacter thiooxydans TaxID=416169 RepID=A0A154QEG2_9GAMM|nr:hypothetical protein [Rhodanobacter thiooxydans]EIL99229.1 hypothetical protein UUA_09486 [Rhodanobacter thiooxydans LCS2]KZC22648.1 hypothetical protein RHOFW104T7_17715 [Rhodanobacter thiooxydans]MCW0202025.1 hypothetical protein [Rhodanobacter thiooxydans]